MNVIFLRAVRSLLDPINKNDVRKTFTVEYCTSAGDIVKGDVLCTSSNFANDTFNFKFPDSGEIRTVHATLLLSINQKEIML
jgi:hypothetical protein